MTGRVTLVDPEKRVSRIKKGPNVQAGIHQATLDFYQNIKQVTDYH